MKSSILAQRSTGELALQTVHDGIARVQLINPRSDYPLVRSYAFPHIEDTYKSPLLNWGNLLYSCSGWGEVDLLRRVLDGLKPCAGLVFNGPEELEAAFALIGPDFDYHMDKPHLNPSSKLHFLNIAARGSLSSLFDLERVLQSYLNLGVGVPEDDWGELEFLANLELGYLSSSECVELLDYDWTSPNTTGQYITTGLLLGYPLESTASLLRGMTA